MLCQTPKLLVFICSDQVKKNNSFEQATSLQFEIKLIFPNSLCSLYNWRYKHLGNLPHVQELPEFQVPNPGLTFDFQLINVEDFNGVGESEPNPYFYQVSDKASYFK